MFNLDTIKETLSHIKMEHKLDQNEKRVMSFAILTLGLLEDMTGSIEVEAQDTSSIVTKEPRNTRCLQCGRTFCRIAFSSLRCPHCREDRPKMFQPTDFCKKNICR